MISDHRLVKHIHIIIFFINKADMHAFVNLHFMSLFLYNNSLNLPIFNVLNMNMEYFREFE